MNNKIYYMQKLIEAANALIEKEPENELWTEIMEHTHEALEKLTGPVCNPDARVGAVISSSPTLIKVWVMTEFFHQIIDMTGTTTRPAGDIKTYAMEPKHLICNNDSYRQVITAQWVPVDSPEYISANDFSRNRLKPDQN